MAVAERCCSIADRCQSGAKRPGIAAPARDRGKAFARPGKKQPARGIEATGGPDW